MVILSSNFISIHSYEQFFYYSNARTLYLMISSNALCNKLKFPSDFLCLSRNLVLVVVQFFNEA